MKLNELTIKEARELLNNKQITAVDLVKDCLAGIKKKNKTLNACLLVDEKKALEAAKAADNRMAQGEVGPLLGIPYLIKDNILAEGWRTTAASKMLDNYIASYDATIVARLNAAGAVLLGKTNLDEFAHGASTETSFYGPTKNPWNTKYSPGGSSGGSAAAVIADLCLFAIGTDTGGSVRHPAAFCGVVGLKPTYGIASRYGLIAMTSSTDVTGTLTKTAEDALEVFDVMAGYDANDLTTSPIEKPNFLEDFKNFSLTGKRIGIVKEFMSDAVDEKIKEKIVEAIKVCEKLGATVTEIDLKHALYGVSVYYVITPSEVSSNLARYDGIRYGYCDNKVDNLAEQYLSSRSSGFGNEVKRRIMLGTYALSAGYYDAYYLKAQKVRTLIIEDFKTAFANVDFLLGPTTPSTAFKIGEQINDPLKMYLEDIFLTPASLAGLPAVSVPAGLVDGLPVGLQMISKPFNEGELLAAAGIINQALVGGRLRLE